MKRNILISSVLGVFLSIVLIHSVYAIGLKVEPNIAGTTCGVAGTENNRCCSGPKIEFDFSLGSDVFLAPFNSAIGFVTKPFNSIPNRMLRKADRFTRKVLGKNKAACIEGEPSTDPSDNSCVCNPSSGASLLNSQGPPATELCELITDNDEKENCIKCVSGVTRNNEPGVWTSFACVKADPSSFIQITLLNLGITIGGIIALLCLIYSAIKLQISRGNPDKVQTARESLTSCILGLLLIIFSVFILRLIGVTVLSIPGLN